MIILCPILTCLSHLHHCWECNGWLVLDNSSHLIPPGMQWLLLTYFLPREVFLSWEYVHPKIDFKFLYSPKMYDFPSHEILTKTAINCFDESKTCMHKWCHCLGYRWTGITLFSSSLLMRYIEIGGDEGTIQSLTPNIPSSLTPTCRKSTPSLFSKVMPKFGKFVNFILRQVVKLSEYSAWIFEMNISMVGINKSRIALVHGSV